MNKVTSVNLAGRAYQMEETGYEKLRAYLDQAAAKLSGNPDKEEIVADFEMAIAEKCGFYLNQQKNVITAEEIEKIIKEMGPIEEAGNDAEKSAGANSETGQKAQDETRPKRLYRIKEGSVIAGVCNGMASYFNIDPVLVRIIFVILTLASGGIWIPVYIVMAVIIPRAYTPEELASASGKTPVTAQDLINQARVGFEDFKNKGEWRQWKRQMKAQARQWKREWREERRADYYRYGRPHCFGLAHAVWEIVWLLAAIFGIWYLYNNVEIVHQFLDSVKTAWDGLMINIASGQSY